jgi:hypothetical protein
MRWWLALILVGCQSTSNAPKKQSAGPAWTPIMFNQLHALTPNCEMHGLVWNCTGDATTSTVTLDENKHLVSLEVTDLTIMSDEPPRRFQIALNGVVPQKAIDVAIKHLATAWPTEKETVDGITVTVTRTQKEAGHPTLHSVTFSW